MGVKEGPVWADAEKLEKGDEVDLGQRRSSGVC